VVQPGKLKVTGFLSRGLAGKFSDANERFYIPVQLT
jgi:hypothetical protein